MKLINLCTICIVISVIEVSCWLYTMLRLHHLQPSFTNFPKAAGHVQLSHDFMNTIGST